MGQAVTGPDGQDYQFPDGTTKDAAIAYFKSKGIGASVTAPAKLETTSTGITLPAGSIGPSQSSDYMSEAAKGIGRGIKAIAYDFPKFIVQNIGSSEGPGGALLREGYEGLHRGYEARQKVASEGEGVAGQTLATLEQYPMIGPMVQRAEKAGPGYAKFTPDTAGVVAEGATLAAAPEVIKRIPAATKILAQETAGAGKEIVADAERSRAAKIQSQQSSYQDATQKSESQHQAALQDHQAKVDSLLQTHQEKLQAAKADYENAVADYNSATADKKATYADKVTKLQQDWVTKAYAAEKAADDALAVKNRADVLERGQSAYADALKDNIQSTHEAVRGSLNQRWSALRDQVGPTAEVSAPPLYSAVEASRRMLAGVPEDLKVFNDIVNQITQEGASVDAGGGELQPVPKSGIPFDQARIQFSALGDKAFAASGNLRRALRNVYDAYDTQLSSTADSAGAGKEYGAIKKDWSQYMQDWKNLGAVATGGSPLAKALLAPHADFVRSTALAKGGDLLTEALGRYKDYGANPNLAANIRRLSAASKELPSVRVPARPNRPAIPPPPDVGEPPTMKEVKPPNLPEPPTKKTVTPPRSVPPVSPYEVRLRELEQMSGRPFGWFDTFPPRFVERMLLKSPRFREWVASQPRNELPVGRVGAVDPAVPPPPSQ